MKPGVTVLFFASNVLIVVGSFITFKSETVEAEFLKNQNKLFNSHHNILHNLSYNCKVTNEL